jgi:hypothetical protein
MNNKTKMKKKKKKKKQLESYSSSVSIPLLFASLTELQFRCLLSLLTSLWAITAMESLLL